MEFSTFKKVIDCINELWDEIDALRALGIDCYDTKSLNTFTVLETTLWKETYGDKGADWISWFLYEKMTSKNPEEFKAYDEHNNEICANVEELYKFLEENYSKNLDNSK